MNILIVHRDKKFNSEFLIKKFPTIKIKSIWKNKFNQNNLKNIDLVISIGGDGTFLSASHYITTQLILGVNSDHKRSEGALTTILLEDLEKKLEKIIQRKFKIKEYTREQVKIVSKNKCILTELALNETFFGNLNPHHTSNYSVHYNNKFESQKSSGVIISTGAGSTAWYKTAGGFPFRKTKKQLRFRIRELYARRLHRPKIRKGKIKLDKKLLIISNMNHGIVAIDSIRKYNLRKNDSIIISLGQPLRAII